MDKLSKQKKGFVKDYVETHNGTQAVLNNMEVKNENVAGVTATRLLRDVKIQNAIKSIAEQIPDSLLVDKLKLLLNKEEVVTKNNMTTGEIDVIPTGQIDVQAVSKGLDMTFKLKGAYAPDKTINLNIEIDSSDEIKELAKRLDELDKK